MFGSGGTRPMRTKPKDSRFLLLLGIVFLLIAIAVPTRNRFVITSGAHKIVITRTGNPLVYWGTELAAALASAGLFAASAYRRRRR